MIPAPCHFVLSRFGMPRAALLVLSSAILFTAGCAERRPKFRFADAAYARPIVPAPAPGMSVPQGPEMDGDPTAAPPHLTEIRPVPPRPRVAVSIAAEPSRVSKPDEPILAPELPPLELAAAKRDTEQSLGVADATLARTGGRLLNASQRDLVTQIRSFASSARDASRNGDWPAARSLARKAEVLARELAGTL